MRHVILTCKHHPNLRWMCKEIAFTPGYGYNGCRHIFYNGDVTKTELLSLCYPPECPCPPTDLILAPEEIENQKTNPTYPQYVTHSRIYVGQSKFGGSPYKATAACRAETGTMLPEISSSMVGVTCPDCIAIAVKHGIVAKPG